MNRSLMQSRSRAGFTLVEVMIAAAMLGAGIIGMMQVITSGSQMLDTSRKQAIAMQIIDSEIERLRSSDSTALNSLFAVATDTATVSTSNTTKLNYSSSTPASFRTIDAVVAVNTTFQCVRTIAAVSGKSNFKQVTFTVSWTGYGGRTLSRKGTTYVGRDGLNVSYRR